MRIVRFLGRVGVASRRKAAELLDKGLIEVNGKLVREPWFRVDPERDNVTLHGKKLNLPIELTYILLNKPKGVISTCSDEHGRITVINIIDESMPGLVPVGRLDENSEGLILITNDGELVYELTHPSFEVEKEYKVILEKKPGEDIISLTKGIKVGKDLIKASSIRFAEGKTVFITLKEGKNREIRRMFGSLGYGIDRLIRIRIGNLKLGNLRTGRWRRLKSHEIGELKKLSHGSDETFYRIRS